MGDEHTNGSSAAQPSMKERLTRLEQESALQAQTIQRLAAALGAFLASAMQPQLKDQLTEQLLGGGGSPLQMPIPKLNDVNAVEAVSHG
jgi:uncharacterized coiled-coil protein SlyX